MKQWATAKSTGFTIVELLIVVVVIAILAAITLISYNGIKDRAVAVQVEAGLSEANKKVQLYAADPANNGNYPATLADAGVTDTKSVTYQYTVDTTVTPASYLITASNGIAGTTTYYMGSDVSSPVVGTAPGHNLMPWNKPDSASAPVKLSSSVVVDTSVYRTSTSSVRIGTNSSGNLLRSSPFSGSAGQTYTVSLWIKTDSNWNGTGDNSKIRFGNNDGTGALLQACGYSGVKTSWTQVTCSYTLTSTSTSVSISVGNNGTVGAIWLDDVSVSLK